MTLLILISNEVGHCGRIRKPLVFIRARMYVRTKNKINIRTKIR